jgi:predicted DNA-binding protein
MVAVSCCGADGMAMGRPRRERRPAKIMSRGKAGCLEPARRIRSRFATSGYFGVCGGSRFSVFAVKTETLSIRVESDLIARMKEFESRTGVEKATLVRAAVRAVLGFYEANGFISFPIEVVRTAGKGS